MAYVTNLGSLDLETTFSFKDIKLMSLPIDPPFQLQRGICNMHKHTCQIIYYCFVHANRLVAGLLKPLVVHHIYKVKPWYLHMFIYCHILRIPQK